jgi:hypothetical protein
MIGVFSFHFMIERPTGNSKFTHKLRSKISHKELTRKGISLGVCLLSWSHKVCGELCVIQLVSFEAPTKVSHKI